jgi:hypothetical protein
LENKMLVLAMQFSRSLERAPTAISGAGAPQKKDADRSETTMIAPLAGHKLCTQKTEQRLPGSHRHRPGGVNTYDRSAPKWLPNS